MRNEIFTTGLTAEYTVVGPTGLTFGTFHQWEDAQKYASAHVSEPTTSELMIMRGGETLEIINREHEPISLKIISGGICNWCQNRTDVITLDHLFICQNCSAECGFGDQVWDYLRG